MSEPLGCRILLASWFLADFPRSEALWVSPKWPGYPSNDLSAEGYSLFSLLLLLKIKPKSPQQTPLSRAPVSLSTCLGKSGIEVSVPVFKNIYLCDIVSQKCHDKGSGKPRPKTRGVEHQLAAYSELGIVCSAAADADRLVKNLASIMVIKNILESLHFHLFYFS